jgi:prepilin-type N-terminal cleavage/methylation domain-containing protein
MTRKAGGFTLIELMLVVGIIGILAVTGIVTYRSAFRDANVGRASFDLSARLRGLRSRAIADGNNYVFVLIDAPLNNAQNCGKVFGSFTNCVRYFIIRNPLPAWTVAAFDPANPTANTDMSDPVDCALAQPLHCGGMVEWFFMPMGVRMDNSAAPVPPPFTSFKQIPAIGGGQQRLAVEFGSDGTVFHIDPAPGRSGVYFAVGSDMTVGAGGSNYRKGFAISFPSGIVRTFAF